MPVPLLIPIGTAAIGFVAGMLSRQPEINRLKQQVRTLQAEIIRLRKLIEEQNRQIEELKIRYNVLKGYQFVQKVKQEGYIKGAIVQQYAFKEYTELCCVQVRGGKLTEEQVQFFNAYELVLNNVEIPKEKLLMVRNFVVTRHLFEIKNLIPVNPDSTIEMLENTNAA